MNWTPIMHGVGIGCLFCIACVAVGIIIGELVPNWARIWDTACGRPWPVSCHPASPTASVLPLRTSHSQLRAVEADAQPTSSERAA